MLPVKRWFPAQLTWRFGIVVLALTAISLGIGAKTSADTNRNTRCLATYIARNAEVSAVRSMATAEKDAAVSGVVDPLVGVILKLTAPNAKPATRAELEQLRAGAKRYKVAQRELAKKRAANPLPNFPAQCKEANS